MYREKIFDFKVFLLGVFCVIAGLLFAVGQVNAQNADVSFTNTQNDTLFNVSEEGVKIPLGYNMRSNRRFVIYEPQSGRASAASLLEVDENGVLVPLKTLGSRAGEASRNFVVGYVGLTRGTVDTLLKVGEGGVNISLGDQLYRAGEASRNFVVGYAGLNRGVSDTLFKVGEGGVNISLGDQLYRAGEASRNFVVGYAGLNRGVSDTLFRVGQDGVNITLGNQTYRAGEASRNFVVGYAGLNRGVSDTLFKIGEEGVKISLTNQSQRAGEASRNFVVGYAGLNRNPNFKNMLYVSPDGVGVNTDSLNSVFTINGVMSLADTSTSNPVIYGKLFVDGDSLYYQYDNLPPVNLLAGGGLSGNEIDPIFTSSPAYMISEMDIALWDSAYSWGNHADIGYANQIDFMDYSTVTNISASDTSRWHNAYSWGNHADAGYLPATSLSVNAVPYWDGTAMTTGSIYHSDGNVGINTVNPYYALDVMGNVRADTLFGDGSHLTGLPLGLWEKSGMDSIYYPGLVGIGVVDPQEQLDVAGGIKLGFALEQNEGTIQWTGSEFQGYTGSEWISLMPDGGEWQRNQPDTLYHYGFVGIGKMSPQEKLDVEGGIKMGWAHGNNPGTIQWTGSEFQGYTGSEWISLMPDGSPVWQLIEPDTAYHYGRVGIGLASPQEKLDVDGAIRLSWNDGEHPGTIRWTGTDFEGRTTSGWQSLTDVGSGSSPWQPLGDDIYYDLGAVGVGTTPNGILHISEDHDEINPDSSLIFTEGKLSVGGDIPDEKLTVEGVLSLARTGSPTFSADYGKLYVSNTDSRLYYMDNAGMEYDLLSGNVGGDSLWAVADTNIYYDKGNVGIGIAPSYNRRLEIQANGLPSIGAGIWVETSDFNVAPGVFKINNSSNPENALYVSTNGVGDGLYVNNTGEGQAGSFSVTNSTNNSPALRANTQGTGFAAIFSGEANGGGLLVENGDIVFQNSVNDTIFFVNSVGGNIGIGTSMPFSKLDVNGDIHASDAITTDGDLFVLDTLQTNFFQLPSVNVDGYVLTADNQGNGFWEPVPASPWTFIAPDTVYFEEFGVGYVGIGTSTPHAMLDVQTSGSMTSLYQASNIDGDPRWEIDDNFDMNLYDYDGMEKMVRFSARPGIYSYIANDGDFGIGTRNPNEKLTVKGVISLADTIAPGYTPGYGKLYVDSGDSNLYFINGDGMSYNLIDEGSSISVWEQDMGNVYLPDTLAHVGIGTYVPEVGLHVNHNEGVLFEGAMGTGQTLLLGAGTRMHWYPKKAAFRVGHVDGANWDDGNIATYSMAGGLNPKATGTYSVAFGYNTLASGEAAFATGYQSSAEGTKSFAAGYNSQAYGYASVAMGQHTIANGEASVAVGDSTLASGEYSTAFGSKTVAQSSYSTVIGRYNEYLGDPTMWYDTDPLFVIGNGSGEFQRSNAMTVLKNGYVGIDTIPTYTLDVNGDINFMGELLHNGEPFGGGTSPWIVAGPDTIFFGNIGLEHVGIGTDAPAAMLDVKSEENTDAVYRASDYNNMPRWEIDNGFDMNLYDYGGVNPTVKFSGSAESISYIANGGDFGVGTEFPNAKVTVEGAISLADTSYPGSTPGYGKLYVDSGDSNLYFIDGEGMSYNLLSGGSSLWNDSGDGIYYDAGFVGVGTPAPSKDLHIVGQPASSVNLMLQPQSQAGSASLLFGDYESTVVAAIEGVGPAMRLGNDQEIRFTNATGSLTSAIIQTDIGYMGIGTDNPTTQLDINPTSAQAPLRLRTQYTQPPPDTGAVYSDGYGLYYSDGYDWRPISPWESYSDTSAFYSGNISIGVSYAEMMSRLYVETNKTTQSAGMFKTTNAQNASPALQAASYSNNGHAIYAETNGNGAGIYAWNGGTDGTGYAGIFDGGSMNNGIKVNSTVGTALKIEEGDVLIKNTFGDTIFFAESDSGRVGFGTAHPNERVTIDGVLSLRRTNQPPMSSEYGKLYVSDLDNELYYLDNAGTPHNLLGGSSQWAEEDTSLYYSGGNVGVGMNFAPMTSRFAAHVNNEWDNAGEFIINNVDNHYGAALLATTYGSGYSGVFTGGKFAIQNDIYDTLFIANTALQRVGVGIPTPNARLHVRGSGTGTSQAFLVTNSTESVNLALLDNGSMGLGTQGPNATLEIVDNGAPDILNVSSSPTHNGDLLTLTSSGRLGIGTDMPAAQVEIVTEDADSVMALTLTNSTNNGDPVMQAFRITSGGTTYNSAAIVSYGDGLGGKLELGTASDDGFVYSHLIIDSAGNVGIGKGNPVYDLDVIGDINFTGDLLHNGNPFSGPWVEDTSNVYLANNNNFVSIGSADPSSKLTLRHDYATYDTIEDMLEIRRGSMNTVANGIGAGIAFRNEVSNNAFALSGRIASVMEDVDVGAGTTAGLLFQTRPIDGNLTNAMYLDADGNAGVGMTTPNTKLDVNGDFAMRRYNIDILTSPIDDLNTNGYSFLKITSSTPGNFQITGIAGGTDGKTLIIYNSTSYNMTIKNAGTAPVTNQIYTLSDADLVTTGQGSVTLIYDGQDQKWIVTSFKE